VIAELVMSAALLVDGNAIQREINRRRWLKDPVTWVRERAKTHVWSKQCTILNSVRDNRKTAVKSCHGPGKSFTASQAVAWWLDVHPVGEAAVVTTAPSDRQVRVVLWKEIRRVHSRAKLNGRTNQKQWLMTPPGEEEQIVAFGMKPSDYDPTAFQGIHARYVLVAFDEACGITGPTTDTPQSLWDSAGSLLSNDDCRFLAIGNPDDPMAYFAEICKPGSGWNVISVSAFDTPNFTGEEVPAHLRQSLVGHTYVEEARAEWAPNWHWNDEHTLVVPDNEDASKNANPLWYSKVLGQFPEQAGTMGLIPIPWILAAQERSLTPSEPNEIGADMGAGGDSSTTAHRRGPVVRILSEDHNPDTMQTCGKIIEEMRTAEATKVKVDYIGIGTGVYDRGTELGHPFVAMKSGDQPEDTERFANTRAEWWWGLRERFRTGDIDLDPRDKALVSELAAMRYKRTSRGQILVESKADMKKRKLKSPNRADAVMFAFAKEKEPEGGVLQGKVTW